MSSFKPDRFEAYFHAICATAITFVLVSARTVLAVDGDLDPTFGADGKVLTDFDHSTDIANAVAIQADGKLVVVGTTYRDNDFSGEDFAVARYNPDGGLDKTFGVGGKVQTDFPGLAAVASSVALQTDGKIIAAGTVFVAFDPGESSDTDFALARYNPDGTPDATSGNGGQVSTDFLGLEDDAFSVLIQPDGKI